LSLAAAGKYVKDGGNLVYNYLAERNEIDFTKEEKFAFVEQARIELEAEARKRATEAKTPRPLSYYLDEITKDSVITRAKRIALNEHLKRKIMDEF
jgi:hypothetical protein